jgi:hypothetical protein
MTTTAILNRAMVTWVALSVCYAVLAWFGQ